MKDMNIASVKLVNGGLKGLVVTYSMTSEKNGRPFIDEHISKKKAPIHQELEDAFDSLIDYLLEICESEANSDVEVVGVTYNDKGFIITGKKKILGGNKTTNLVTPLITDEDYSEFDTVCKMLDTIYSETEDYMSGAKVFSDAQLVMRFNAGKEDFDVETFKGLSSEEQRDLATAILEDMGHVVLLTEDVAPPEEEPDASEMKLPVPEPEPTMTVVEDDDNFDLPVTKAPKKSALTMVKGEGGAFKIVANEPAKSTAKKVAKG